MLTITVPANTLWDEEADNFVDIKEHTLQLEHSLISLKKWESKWHKPFMDKKKKTYEETLDYIRCMTLTQNVDPNVYRCLTNDNISAINTYIDDPMTGTTVPEDKSAKSSREIVSAELIYYWMISFNIPVEFQKWHLNQLLTLIKVCNVKNAPPKKTNRNDLYKRNAALNAANRKRFNSRG